MSIPYCPSGWIISAWHEEADRAREAGEGDRRPETDTAKERKEEEKEKEKKKRKEEEIWSTFGGEGSDLQCSHEAVSY